jgi:glycosyltransferase involved in cell wall biosynthesis
LYGQEFKVSLLTFRPDSKLAENAANFDETFVLASKVHDDWRRAIDLPRGILRLRHAVREIRPDLIFCIGTFSNVVTSLAIDDPKLTVVLSDHLNMTHRLSGSRFGAVTRFFMRRAYPPRLMIVASQELADDLKQNFGVRRAVVIPNGIDASVVRLRAAEPSAALPPSLAPSRYFVSVGRLTEQKDVAMLVRAFALARRNGMREDLVIAGDGEQRAMLESLAKELNIASNTHFLGHCPNPYPIVKNARALVLSSIWEGFAYVPIEAMALGVPVISTSCPSGPVEILGNGEFGLLVPPRDPPRLAQAMRELANDDALHARLSQKARERADQLSIENMSRQYRDVFLGL